MWNDRHLKTSFINTCNCPALIPSIQGTPFPRSDPKSVVMSQSIPRWHFLPGAWNDRQSHQYGRLLCALEPAICSHCSFKVYWLPALQLPKTASSDRLCHHIGGKIRQLRDRRNCQTHHSRQCCHRFLCLQYFPGFHR